MTGDSLVAIAHYPFMNVTEFIARQEILVALANHSRGIDRADAVLLADAYHPNSEVDYGAFIGSSEEFTSFLAQAQKTARPSLHRTSNISIRVRDDRAVSESYVIAYVEDEDHQRLVFGRYLDSHEKRDGTWRLTKRVYSLEGNTNKPNNADRPDPPLVNDNFTPQGGHGAADPGRILMAFAQAQQKPQTMETNQMAANTDQKALDIALAKVEIHELVTAYCRGVDRADAELLKSIFADDATVISGVFNGNGQEFASQICDFVKNNTDYVFHSVANEWIEVRGDEAVGEHYVIAMMKAGGQDVMTGGRYIDRYVRDGGKWKIKERSFVMDWNRSDPTTMQEGGFFEGLEKRGRWGQDDPVYALWASL